MPRCAHDACRRWRPGIVVRAAGLGLHLDDAWYCSAACLGRAVRHRLARTAPIVAPATATPAHPRLGGVLAVQKQLAPSLVEQAASAQARTGLRIGTQLIALGAVTRLDVLRALAAQNGIGFLAALDPGRLTSAPGDLSPAVVRALGVVPFEADRRHDVLKVACTAPVPRSSLAALRELTGSIIEPYLVADEQWPTVVQAYGAGRRAAGATPTVVTDLEALSVRVTDAARHARSLRMSEARCEDKLWVRLDADGRVEELLLAFDTPAPASATATAEAASPAARPRRARPPRATQPRPRRPRVREVAPDAPITAAAATPPEGSRPAPADERVPAAAIALPAAARASQAALGSSAAAALDLSFLDSWDADPVASLEQ